MTATLEAYARMPYPEHLTPDQFLPRVLPAVVFAKNPKLGERVSATPAIADNVLYVRTEGHLYAFAEKKQKD